MYDEDKARDANYAPRLLLNKGQNLVKVLALVKTVIGIIDGQRLSQGQVLRHFQAFIEMHGNHDPCLEPAM